MQLLFDFSSRICYISQQPTPGARLYLLVITFIMLWVTQKLRFSWLWCTRFLFASQETYNLIGSFIRFVISCWVRIVRKICWFDLDNHRPGRHSIRTYILWNEGTIAKALGADVSDGVISDFEELVSEYEAIRWNSEHGAFSANSIDKFIDLFIVEQGRRGCCRHLIEDHSNLINFIGHLIEERISIALESFHNIRAAFLCVYMGK